VEILDVSKPEKITRNRLLPTLDDITDIYVKEHYLYVGGENGLSVYDVNNVDDITKIFQYNSSGQVDNIEIQGDYLYFLNAYKKLFIMDLSDMDNIHDVSNISIGADCVGLKIIGDYAYIINYNKGIVIVDIENKDKPVTRKTVSDYLLYKDIYIDENILILHDSFNIYIFDTSNPIELKLIGEYEFYIKISYIYYQDDIIYASKISGELVFIDISNPKDPKTIVDYPSGGNVYYTIVNAGNLFFYDNTKNAIILLDIDKDNDGHLIGSDTYPNTYWLNSRWQTSGLVICFMVIICIISYKLELRNLKDKREQLIDSLSEKINYVENLGLPHELETNFLEKAKARKPSNLLEIKIINDIVTEGLTIAEEIEATGKVIDYAKEASEKLVNNGYQYDFKNINEAINFFMNFNHQEARKKATAVIKEVNEYRNVIKRAMDFQESLIDDIEEASEVIDIVQFNEYPEQIKKHVDSKEPFKAEELLNDIFKKIDIALSEWEPLLTTSVPDSLKADTWERVKISIRNNGKAHAYQVSSTIEGLESKPIPIIPEIIAGEEQEIEVAVRSEKGTIPIHITVTSKHKRDNRQFTFDQKKWVDVKTIVKGTDDMKSKKKVIEEKGLILLRQTENFRGYVRVKIAVTNNHDNVATDAGLELHHDNKVLRFEKIEPEYRMHGGKVLLGNLSPGERKTVNFYLDPQICTTTFLDGTIAYKDSRGEIIMSKMRRKDVNVVCPIFFTKETANPAMMRNLVQNVLEHHDSKLYALPKKLKPKEALRIARESLAGRDIQFVRELIEPKPFVGEAWYYGTTKVKGYQIAIRASVREETHSIEIFGAAPDPEVLTGLLAELGHELQEGLAQEGLPAQQITNITIKDSILNRSSLLLSKEEESSIDDSLVSGSSIGISIADEIRKLKDLVDEGLITQEQFQKQRDKLLDD